MLALIEAIKTLPPPVVQVTTQAPEKPVLNLENVENELGKSFSKPEIEREIVKTALPSKMELAVQWLREHREDMALTGRELKEQRKPQGVEISHKTWNDAKKLVDDSGGVGTD